MKALIVSDNHGRDSHLYELIEKYRHEVDLWLHCGDSEFSPQDPVFDIFKPVRGNMDWGDFPVLQVSQWHGINIMHTHGHLYGVNYGLEQIYETAVEYEAPITFYGHTHVATIEEMEGRYFINPGSLNFPRGALRIGSYAILEMGEQSAINFYTNVHERLPDLSQSLNI